MKRCIFISMFSTFIAMMVACGEEQDTQGNSDDASGSEESYVLAFGGATPGGAAYQISTAYSEIINTELDHVQVNVEVTGGGADNVALINNGELDSGHGNSGVGYHAFHGEGEYEGDEHDNLRGWLPVYDYPFQVVVLEDSDIASVSDLQGKRIGVNVQGSGGEVTSQQVFDAIGLIRYEDYEPFYLDYDEAADALSTGRIDATIFSTGAPTPALTELGTTNDIRILEFTDEELSLVDEEYSFLTGGTLPGGTYSDIEQDINTVFAATINYVSADLPDDLVYDLTKAVWENRDRLIEAHPTQENLNADLIESALIPIMPLHPGAESYYKENGIIED
ncbi:TAXI family TRAP transporter solute-binding subunit [Evansella halocellulosilytica]|uniref:TAXI family TRAP transporter solute-binding subunit n=1 Tax=Evansella halocellulosilytica TaxID=2011013 RepID=UPI0015CC88A7|nr:TAXI family TRAP transporter solute-binding subunit [Evansella halocellulosilytica]